MAKKKKEKIYSTEEKLVALYNLQSIDSELEQIRILRGELPIEVSDLEDELAGHSTRIEHINEEIAALNQSILERTEKIANSKAAIEKYSTQLKNVRNNREFEALTKEVEFQELEIQLSEKKINEFKVKIEFKNELIVKTNEKVEDSKQNLEQKKAALDQIIAETQKDEEKLTKQQSKAESVIDARLLKGYKRLRTNLTNKLAVAKVDRESCGGCFAKVPPQRQLDIAKRTKIIVCEHCGRILVDDEIGN
ncbi:MAG: zinc ribbon domain-containing protein [Flavobacteriales bacterium]